MEYTTRHDVQAQRYEVSLEDGHMAWVSYSNLEDGVIALDYSEVPGALRGKGYGAIMMENVLAAIDAENKQVVPICGYTKHYINRHEQWLHLLHESAR
ncbi:MAG: GNAT family N-acetyltransferase [Halioglobus sp.]